MFLFRPQRSERRPRYVGTSSSPLPSTPRAHLAAIPLSLHLVIMQSVCAGAVATDQRAFVFDQARVWRTSPRVGLGRVLPPQRVGVRLPLLWGRQIDTTRLGLNPFFVFTDGVRIESESQEQCEWMYRMFSHHSLPSPASWCFTLLSKELPALLRCMTTGNSDRVSKRLQAFLQIGPWSHVLVPGPMKFDAGLATTSPAAAAAPTPGRASIVVAPTTPSGWHPAASPASTSTSASTAPSGSGW